MWSQRQQPTRLCHPWDSPGKNTVVGCHFLLHARKWKVKVKSLSRVRLLATPWTAAHQAPPSVGFSRQESWSGVPSPSPLHPFTIWQIYALCTTWPRLTFSECDGRNVTGEWEVKWFLGALEIKLFSWKRLYHSVIRATIDSGRKPGCFCFQWLRPLCLDHLVSL